MAVVFKDLKEQIRLVLYDYMLTSDHEAFWFGIPEIREALSEETSGAFVKRALDALIDEGEVEEGRGGEPEQDVFALTEDGIQSTERILEERGQKVRLYSPAPSADRILSRIDDENEHKELEKGFKELREAISKNNLVASELGDVRDIIEVEVNVAQELTAKERFRVSRLAAFIIPTLRFLSEKFFGEAVGELAKRLIDLLMRLT
jgi:DNA-binding PadR family transcriptional regulator